MSHRITVVSTKGQFVIPSEMRESLGITPGTRISVVEDGKRIILQPISEELVEKTRGLFKGKGSLSSELKRQRLRKDKW